jgi:oxygen-dependent protoporphyrinogen oxidase
MMKKIAVIGAGVSGLSAAYRLNQLDPSLEVTVFERASQIGGVIATKHREGFMVEQAADNFITTLPDAVDLCDQLGLADDLIRPQQTCRQACVLSHGRLEPIPPGFIVMAPSRIWPFLSSRILSLSGKLRAAAEFFVRKRTENGDESMESFVCRRFGREMFERLVQPLIGGIYTADPRMLSLSATMPRFIQMEQQYGSVIRGALKLRKRGECKEGGARYSQFMTLRGGMSRLIESLAAKLPMGSVLSETQVLALRPSGDRGWLLRVHGKSSEWRHVDGVIMATPAHISAKLLGSIDKRLAEELQGIGYASCAVVSLGYRKEQIGVPMDTFGFVVPLVEKRLILSCSYSSVKYEQRAPDNSILLRVFIGGACQSNLMHLSEKQLTELAVRELADLMKIRGEPMMSAVKRHIRSMPQYHLGHLERVAAIESNLLIWRGLQLAGSGLHGVGVPNCIRSGRTAAERLFAGICNGSPTTAAV